MTSPLYLRLALPSPLRRLFDYLPPKGSTQIQWVAGIRIRVPFGNRSLIGILVETSDQTDVPVDKLKHADEVIDHDPILDKDIFTLCLWTANYYQHSLGDTFNWALPILLRQGAAAEKKPVYTWHCHPHADTQHESLKRAPKQQAAIAALKSQPNGIKQSQLSQFNLTLDNLKRLEEKQLAFQMLKTDAKKSIYQDNLLAQIELNLNPEQQFAYDAIASQLHHFRCFLLAGVTGSGKTEVYLQLIRDCLQQGKQVLVLIPEINLGPQTVNRFTQRFNATIALLHSEVNDRQRLDAWIDAKSGSADIVIGTRSALFTPMPNLGLIIIDEEHDSSYKQQEGLRYHARDVAIVRAKHAEIPIILGSATPSLESLHNAKQGRYGLLKLKQRAGNAKPPELIRLDIKSLPLEAGLSLPLQKEIKTTLDQGQQVLIFLNRRGFSPVLMCQNCGWMGGCPECDARLTLHQRYSELRCHHCGYQEPRPHQCPKCQHVDLRPIGAGTERTEERLTVLFPKTPILRIDRDSTTRKGTLEKMLAVVDQGDPCILLGTQMLAKGHHFPKVTLVAVLNADGGLFSADFRASEYMAQQIMQVAGRAGRGKDLGRVIIQSHLADHPLLMQLTEQGYFAFAQQALDERRATHLPPYSYMALLRAESVKPEHTHSFLSEAEYLAQQLFDQLNIHEVDALGPVAAPMERRAGKYRAQLLFISSSRASLHKLLHALTFNLEPLASARRVRWSLDIDPIDLF